MSHIFGHCAQKGQNWNYSIHLVFYNTILLGSTIKSWLRQTDRYSVLWLNYDT